MAQRCSRRLTALSRQLVLRATMNAVCPKSYGCPAYLSSTSWTTAQFAAVPLLHQECNRRAITTFPSLAASIKVPSMGESIEEGTISAILKQEGDSVEMDEAIFQIETDKVTVDVRAPGAGVINKILVKADDTVRVGQELADVGGGSGGEKPRSSGMSQEQSDTATAKAPVEDDKTKLEDKPIAGEPMGGEPSPSDTSSAPSSQPDSSKRQQDSAQSTSRQDASKQNSQTADAKEATPSPGADTGKPSIRFPRRRTPDGQRISALSAEEQEKYRETDATTGQQGQSEGAASQPQAASRQPQKPSESEPNKFVPYTGQDRGTKLSQARVLSAREMELIELGGAEPY